jgi:hypothetical protein
MAVIPIAAHSLMRRMADEGILPKHCRRVIIDIQVNGIPQVYFECHGDERMYSIERELALVIREHGTKPEE